MKDVEVVQYIEILSFWKKKFMTGTTYKWNFAVFGIGSDCNRIHCKKILLSLC